MTIEKTLAERGKTYGPFLDKAKTVQALIDVVIHEPGWERLAADQKQCIMVCFDKFARAIHGDPNHRDNFHDVIGYAKLVDDRMAADEMKAGLVEAVSSVAEAVAGVGKAFRNALRSTSCTEPTIGPEDGWKPWTGGERPGTAETEFDVRTRNGQEFFGVKTGENSWRHSGHEHDIVAYRECKPAEGEWIEWGGSGHKPRNDGVLFDLRLRSGVEVTGISPTPESWRHSSGPHDIIAYRLSPVPRT